MRIITTAVLAGIAIILSTVIHFVDRPAAVSTKGKGNMLARFEPPLVDEVIVKSSSGTVRIEKNIEGEWFFTEPITDRIDPSAMSAMLDQLNHLKILDEINRAEIGGTDQISAGDMGLDSAGLIRVEIANSNPDTDIEAKEFSTALLIGIEAPLNNAIYARVPDDGEKTDGGVAVVDGNPRKYLVDPIETLRDKKLLSLQPERLVKVVLKTATGDIEVMRKVTLPMVPWTLMKPTQTRANAEVLEELVSGIGAIRVVDVLEDGEAEAIPNPVPDDALVFELMFFGMELPVTLLLKQHYDQGKSVESEDGKPVLEASISNRPARFLVESELLAKLPKTASAYRDLHFLKVEPLAQKRIIIRSRTQPEIDLQSVPTQSGLQWSVMINGRLQPANQGNIAKMIQAVNDAQVVEFVSESQARLPEFGLDRPATQVTFQSYPSEGQTEQDGLKILQLGRKADEETKLYGNVIGRPYIYEVPQDLQSAIPTHISNWKSTKLLSFSQFNLKEIIRVRAGEPTIKMKYDLKKNAWDVTKDGKDVSKQLNDNVATTMLTRLGSLTATGWVVSLGGPTQKLKTPSTIFRIKLIEFDPAIGEEAPVEHKLEFAPSNSEALYYGRLDGSPDVFHTDSKTYNELIRGVLKSHDGPGN